MVAQNHIILFIIKVYMKHKTDRYRNGKDSKASTSKTHSHDCYYVRL